MLDFKHEYEKIRRSEELDRIQHHYDILQDEINRKRIRLNKERENLKQQVRNSVERQQRLYSHSNDKENKGGQLHNKFAIHNHPKVSLDIFANAEQNQKQQRIQSYKNKIQDQNYDYYNHRSNAQQ